MKRNRFGINLDEGVPLQTKEIFDQLYVECFISTVEILLSWTNKGKDLFFIGKKHRNY
ncbi:MAG: hypothetical protein ACOX4L_09115 [Bacillota bacterium]|jgi:hypothetical protein